MSAIHADWRGRGRGSKRSDIAMVAARTERVIGASELLSDLPNRLEDQDVLRLATLGLMTVGVTHDLGNLLQAVGSAIRLIDRKLDDDARTEFAPLMECALESLARASALSRNILDLSKCKAALNEITCLDRTLGGIRQLVTLTAGPGVIVDVSLDGSLPPVVCNTRELENAILNLVINARDAMPVGGRLVISTHLEIIPAGPGAGQPADVARVVLSVTDTGCGMSPDLARQAFQPFFTTKPDDKGTGLGLAMVSDFARRAGGSAEIESVVDFGTTVTLRLPSCGR
jgi:signal transduction histidine kinase